MKGIIKKKRKRKTLMFQRKSELCVAVIKGQEKALEFQFNKEFYFMSGPGESKGLTPQELRLLYVVNTGSELVE